MPIIKGKIETITTRDQEETTPNKTILLEATKINATKTTKEEKIKINHDKGIPITS
jgi:hypothetical protein